MIGQYKQNTYTILLFQCQIKCITMLNKLFSISVEMYYRNSAYASRMQTIMIKYLQLFCIATSFDNVQCDNLPLEASQDDVLLIREGVCTAGCMAKNIAAVCINSFNKLQSYWNVKKVNSSSYYKYLSGGRLCLCRFYRIVMMNAHG